MSWFGIPGVEEQHRGRASCVSTTQQRKVTWTWHFPTSNIATEGIQARFIPSWIKRGVPLTTSSEPDTTSTETDWDPCQTQEDKGELSFPARPGTPFSTERSRGRWEELARKTQLQQAAWPRKRLCPCKYRNLLLCQEALGSQETVVGGIPSQFPHHEACYWPGLGISFLFLQTAPAGTSVSPSGTR